MRKKTQKEFERDVTIVNPEIKVLGEYINNATKIRVKCEKCSRIWDAVPTKITIHYQCPLCDKQKEFTSFLSEHGLVAIEPYQDNFTKLKVQCTKCHYSWNVIPKVLKRDSRCPKCYEKGLHRKWTNDNLVAELQVRNPNIVLLDKNHGYDVKIPCQCRVCGYEFFQSPHKLLAGKGCPQCNGHRNWTAIQFEEQVSKVNPDIIVTGFTRMKEKVHCKCRVCGYEWTPQAYDIASNHSGCPRCHKREPLNFQHFKEEFMLANPTIEILDMQVRTVTDLLSCQCKRCGNIWKTNVARLKDGNGCMLCSRSSTSFVEQAILQSFRLRLGKKAVLSRNKIAIGKEIDIYIPSKGIAFEPGTWFFHRRSIEKDTQKRLFCSEKGIRLITIYYDYPEQEAPFSSDCFAYRTSLGEINDRAELKALIDTLFGICNIAPVISSKEWKSIQNYANEKSMRQSSEQILKDIRRANPYFSFLEKPTRMNESILCRCDKCGYEWHARVANLKRGMGCRNCNGNRQLTQEEFIKELKEKHPKVKALEEYKNITHPILFHCFDCDTDWKKPPRAMIRQGSMCPVCSKKQKLLGLLRARNFQISDADLRQIDILSKNNPTNQYNTNEFIWLVSKINPNIEIVGQYTTISGEIDCVCKQCNNPWTPRAQHLLNGHGCPICNNFFVAQNHNPEQLLSAIKKVYKYDLEGNYLQEYENIQIAADEYHVTRKAIKNACIGKTQVCAGYQWRSEKKDSIEQSCKNAKKKIYKYDIDGKYLQEYACARIAAEELHVYASSIRKACSGKTKTCAGFRWSYNKDSTLL